MNTLVNKKLLATVNSVLSKNLSHELLGTSHPVVNYYFDATNTKDPSYAHATIETDAVLMTSDDLTYYEQLKSKGDEAVLVSVDVRSSNSRLSITINVVENSRR